MKILYVTTIGGTMSFFIEHFKMLIAEGHSVELACNTSSPVEQNILDLDVKIHNVQFSRTPLSCDNIIAYRQLYKIVKLNSYDIIHCHTPNAAVITRLVCKKMRKLGLKVFYTAHGFHFYKGAPIKNWMMYYPVEWLCAHWTDVLILINQEDYKFAQKHIKAKQIEYIPGIGLNLNRFSNVKVDKVAKRNELNIPEDCFLMTSVGELNRNKNHEIIIRAMAELKNAKVHYAIAGKGENRLYLLELARKLGVSEQLHLLGFRKDIPELYYISDICCFPSFREGLGMAVLEGMACGLPVIVANNRGTRDVCINGKNGIVCEARDVYQFRDAIEFMILHPEIRCEMAKRNLEKVKKFEVGNVLEKMHKIYNSNI